MAIDVFDDVGAEYRLLIDVLLRLPRHPRREQRRLWRRAVEIAPGLEPGDDQPPVAAVAIDPRDEGDALVVLVADELSFDPAALAVALDVRAPVELERSGRFVAAARPALGGDSISGDGTGGDTGRCAAQSGANAPATSSHWVATTPSPA